MSVTITDPREQLADALRYCRENRHHPDCRCHSWRDQQGQAFCTPAESTWNKAVNRCLDRVLGRLL